jgi:hypothetical protein
VLASCIAPRHSPIVAYSAAASSIWHPSTNLYSNDDRVDEEKTTVISNPWNNPVFPCLDSFTQQRGSWDDGTALLYLGRHNTYAMVEGAHNLREFQI